jgi:hypothetical protein
MSAGKFSSSRKRFTNFDIPRPTGSVIGPPKRQTLNHSDQSQFDVEGVSVGKHLQTGLAGLKKSNKKPF